VANYMTQLCLTPLERVDHLDRKTFIRNYLKPGRPVVFRNFADSWPAMERWNYDFLKQGCGHIEVPLYDGAFAGSGDDYMAANKTMRFADYLDLIQRGPTDFRMFLFNIFKHMPQLCDDFTFPDLGVQWLKKHPFVFFGGQGSYVDAHYDLDHSHVFLTQFSGERRVVLYAPRCSKQLYRHPFTVSSNIDLHQPDFDTYPQLAKVQGFEVTLRHGDTVFMPSRWWHYIEYNIGGFGMALRAMPRGVCPKARGLWSIAKLKLMDYNIGRVLGHQRWYQIKENWAQRLAR